MDVFGWFIFNDGVQDGEFYMWWTCLINIPALTLAQGHLCYMPTIMLYLPNNTFEILRKRKKDCSVDHSGMYRIGQSVLNGMIYMWVDCTSCFSPGHFGGKWAMASCLFRQHLFNQLVKI